MEQKESKNLKLTGEQFEEALDIVIKETKSQIEAKHARLGRLKANPYDQLMNSGRMRKDFIVREMPKIQNKTSTLSSSQRQVVSALISLAIRKAVEIDAMRRFEKDMTEKAAKEKNEK